MATPTIGDMMIAYAEDAVNFAHHNFGISLDYSNESIRQIEAIAEKLVQARPKGIVGKLLRRAPSEDEVQKVCKMLGGYIGEVHRRAKGGEWALNQEHQALGLRRADSWIFPTAKVHKRLSNGAEDNLWVYFNVLLEGQQGTE
jgi:hypothetical protein